jgi:hypothetical protein
VEAKGAHKQVVVGRYCDQKDGTCEELQREVQFLPFAKKKEAAK